jgi:hypothetical protein
MVGAFSLLLACGSDQSEGINNDPGPDDFRGNGGEAGAGGEAGMSETGGSPTRTLTMRTAFVSSAAS